MLVAWQKLVPECYYLITKSNPWISIETLEMFTRIGKMEIHPKILLLPPMLANRASHLSYAEQENLVSKPAAEIRKRLVPSQGRHREHERGLADKLPTVGYFQITMLPSGPIIVRIEESRWGAPIVLDRQGSCIVQLLKPYD